MSLSCWQRELRDLREARAGLTTYAARFSTPESAMRKSLELAIRCIDNEMGRVAERRQITIAEYMQGGDALTSRNAELAREHVNGRAGMCSLRATPGGRRG